MAAFHSIIYGRFWVITKGFVWFHTAEGRLSQVPLNFTDLVEPDPYVAVSSGRAYLGLKDLLELVDLLQELGQEGENNV
jgi:hypothetical protein